MIPYQDIPARPPLTVELPLAPAYQSDGVHLTNQSVSATLDLSGGTRTFDSVEKTVGTYQGAEVRAKLTFTYHYDKKEDKVTIRGNDDITADQLRITTSLGGERNLAFQHTPNDVGLNLASNHLWGANVKQSPGLSEAMAATVRSCNDILVKALVDAGVSSVLERGTPPVVTLENLNGFKEMFGETVTPLDLSAAPAEVARIQFIVDSTYVGTVTWTATTTFANVIGSTQDPKPSGVTSWLELWANKCNNGHDTTLCSSYNFFSKDTTWTCTSVLVGGHVIPGTTAKSMAKGSTVYIYPICSRHNGSDPNSMKCLYNPKGVQLSYW
jgi:hypothetical protein